MSVPIKQRMTAEQRRTAIVDAAVDLFSRRGFRGTTTRELAAAVGVTEPVLYQHFQTKRALYRAIIEANINDERYAGLAAELERHTEAGESKAFFTRLATILLEWYLEDPRYCRMLMFSRLEDHELSDLFYERHVACYYEWVTRHVEHQVARGRIRDMDPLLAARVFGGMVAHQGMVYAILRPGELPASKQTVIANIVDIFLHGVSFNETGNR
jgi:AcrR family transcriptional regulator